MITIAELADEFNFQPRELAEFLDLGPVVATTELDAATESMVRAILALAADRDL